MDRNALIFVVLGFGFVVTQWVIAYRLRKEVNGHLTPFERIPDVMWSLRYLRMLRLHRQFFPSSWLRHVVRLCEIGFLLCVIEALRFAK